MKINISGDLIKITAENEPDKVFMELWVGKKFQAKERLVGQQPYSPWPVLYLKEIKE